MNPRPEHRILIVGAGPAGIHMAHVLKELGFEDLVLLERSDRYGGKSETLWRDGAPREMGTCYLHPGYSMLLSLISDLGITEAYKPGGREGRRDMFTDLVKPDPGEPPPDLSDWFLRMVERSTFPKWLWWAPDKLQAANVLLAVRKYNRLHREIFGEYRYTLPPEPTDDQLASIDMSFLEWLRRHELEALVPLLVLSTTAQGYGLLETLPAFYGLWWNTPTVMDGFIESSRDPDKPVLSMLRDGYSSVWDALVSRHSLDIRFGVDIDRISRDGGVKIEGTQNGQSATWEGDFLVLACNLRRILRVLADPSAEEIEIFSNLETQELTTTLVRATHEPEASCIAYWPDVLRVGDSGRLYSRRDGLKCRDPEAPDRATDLWVCYQYADHYRHDEAQIRIDQLERELLEVGMGQPEIVEQRRWPYFSRFNQDGINRRYPWRLWRMQGRHLTWYAGASACFESVNDVMNYNQMLTDQKLG